MIRDHLETIGESVLVAGDGRALKVHVHNERPDQVIGYGLGLGSLSRISVENLDNQARDVRETRAAAFTGGGNADGEADPSDGTTARAGNAVAGDGAGRPVEGGANAVAVADGPRPVPAATDRSDGAAAPALGVVAVTAGDGLAAIFRDFGVASVVQGGQSANPSTGELLEALRRLSPHVKRRSCRTIRTWSSPPARLRR